MIFIDILLPFVLRIFIYLFIISKFVITVWNVFNISPLDLILSFLFNSFLFSILIYN